MKRMLLVVWLTVLWLVLWRDASVANLASGLAIAFVVTAGGLGGDREATGHRVAPLALIRFAAYFLVKLVEANLVLAREVVTPQNDINTGIVAIPLTGYSDFVVTVIGNAVSLTPGTLTLEVRREPEPVLYVHVLHLHDLDETRAEVVRMAQRARAAFPCIDDPGTPDDRTEAPR